MIRRSLLLLVAAAACAFAQLGEIALSFGTVRTRNNVIGTTDTNPPSAANTVAKIDANFRFGFRFTFNNPSHFGHEIGYGYNRGKLNWGGVEYGMPIHQGMYNFLVYAFKEGSAVRPFATGGVHFSSFYPPGASVFSGNGVTKFGFNYGGGLKVKVADSFLVRFDIRDYAQGKPDFGQPVITSGLLHLLEVSAGLAFTF